MKKPARHRRVGNCRALGAFGAMLRVEPLERRILLSGGADGSGLSAQYFDDKNFTNLKFTRIDATVNFDWGLSSPDPSIGVDGFSIRWTGQVIPQTSEAYTFSTTTDDGVRLWIGGQLVIDHFGVQPATRWSSAPTAMTAGQPVDVRIDYFENNGRASAKLMWSSASMPMSIIPQSDLSPGTAVLPPAPPPPPPPPVSPPPGSRGTGLSGEYFARQDFTGSVFSRIDPTVNFDWGSGSPDPAIAPDHFSVRWTGQVIAPASDDYIFSTTTDDGVRLWINDALVIDHVGIQAATSWSSAPIHLTGGQAVDVRMDYFENNGRASAKLMWSSAAIAKSIIPQADLYPAAPLPPAPPPPPLPPSPPPPLPPPPSPPGDFGLIAQYFNNKDFTSAVFSRTDATINFDWGSGSPAPSIAPDTFSIRWSGQIVAPAADTYTFSTSTDDGVRLWIGGQLMIDKSFDQAARVWSSAPITLAAGQAVDVRMDYYENTGLASAKLMWSSASMPRQIIGQSNLRAVAIPNPPGVIDWQTVAPSPIPRAEAPGAVVNGKLYIFGGYYSAPDGSIIAQSRCDVYDPATNIWTRLGDMPVAFTHAGIAVDGTTIWLVGHYTGDHPGPGSTEVWKYDTLNDTWSRGPDLPEARGAGGAAIVGRTLHFFGGMDETRTIEEGTHWSLDLDDPSAGWIERAPLPNPRNHTAGAALDGKIYCIGGQYNQEEDQISQGEVDCYDPATDTWTVVAPLPSPRSHIDASTFVMNGRIIVLGGEVGYDQPQESIYAYDPQTNSWSTIGYLPAGRSTSVAGMLDQNHIISATGNGPDATTTTWIGSLVTG